jgi:predicted TIM-barrel fold metal-dependent hydrolase
VPPNTAAADSGWDCHVHVFDAQAPVRAGHYTPAHHPLQAIEDLAATQGLQRLVLVQPSVYGDDHRVLLQALQQQPGRHRGVAVLPADVSEAQLDTLHAAGVRGVRFNRVSPAGHVGDPEADLQALAPRLRARGWHVQWYVHAAELPLLARWQQQTGLPFVLDHLAGLHAALPATDPAWDAARQLADGGAWVKLSGWYRLQAQGPFDALLPHIQRVATLFGPRLLWGSDWPHTGLPTAQLPAYAALLAPVRAALGDAALSTILRENARALYFHD